MTAVASPSRTEKLRDRLKRHFVTCSAAGAAALACPTAAQADIVYFSSANDPGLPAAIPANFNGIYVNVQTGAIAGSPASGTPFINIYANVGTTINEIYTNPGTVRMVTTTAGGTTVAGLAAGTLIGPGSNFAGTNVGVVGVNALTNPGTTLLGFEFVLAGVTDFGWIRVTGTSASSKSVVDFAYENTGAAIAAGATPPPPTSVPEPSSLSLGLLALGAAGVAALRRRRAAKAAEVA
jgi:hypothetical protein